MRVSAPQYADNSYSLLDYRTIDSLDWVFDGDWTDMEIAHKGPRGNVATTVKRATSPNASAHLNFMGQHSRILLIGALC
jgi:hypothetical protein